MSTNGYDFELVWLTSGDRGTPHAAACQAANPGLRTHVWTAAETGLDGWRNCDRNLRDFWQAEAAEVETDRVLFCEWDVAISCDPREKFPAREWRGGMEGARIMQAVRDGHAWPAFREANRLPAVLRPYLVGVVPSAVLMLSRGALAEVADVRWDGLFSADILSEIRLGTLVRSRGYSVTENPRLGSVGTGPVRADGEGVFHPVKGVVE